eukprot:EG_transcript_38441
MPTLPRSHGPHVRQLQFLFAIHWAAHHPSLHRGSTSCPTSRSGVCHAVGTAFAIVLGSQLASCWAHVRWATAPVEWFFGSISCPEPDGTLCIIRRLCPCPCVNLSSLDNLSFLLHPC